MSARDYFRKIGAAIARRAVISVNDDDRAALAWHGGLRLRLIRPTGYGLTRGAVAQAFYRSPDVANGSRECAPDDKLREIRACF